MNNKNIIWFFLIMIQINSFGQQKLSYQLSGQAIGWMNFNFSESFAYQLGGRYIPEFSAEYQSLKNWKIDGEVSVNSYEAFSFIEKDWDDQGKIKPYRFWLRYSTKQLEIRAGLQKINFGSATMLRPLMWFDRLDPRDPLQLTDGVYGLLSRYYFLNNANIWFWILYGNEEKRGWDQYGTQKEIPEIGGRIQVPVYTGELGLSYHNRFINTEDIENLPANYYIKDFSQNKIGIDGKWDLGIGVWFENVIKHNSLTPYLVKWENQLTLGMDYTFLIGNGISCGYEHLIYSQYQDKYLKSGNSMNLSGINISYPIGVFDNISAIMFYSWKDESFYRFINFGRQYDKVSIYIMAYWNPDRFDISPNSDGTQLFAGKGFQIMLTFNH